MTMLFANNIDWAAVNCSTFTFKPALLVATAGETVVIRTRSWALQFQLEYTWLPVSPCCEYVVCCYYSVIYWHTWSIFDTSSHTAFYLMTLAVLNPHFISKDRCQVHWYYRSRALQRIQPFDRPLYFVVRGPIPMKFKCSCGCRSTALCWCGYCDFMYRTSPTQRYKCWNAVSVRLGLKNKIPRIHLCLLCLFLLLFLLLHASFIHPCGCVSASSPTMSHTFRKRNWVSATASSSSSDAFNGTWK